MMRMFAPHAGSCHDQRRRPRWSADRQRRSTHDRDRIDPSQGAHRAGRRGVVVGACIDTGSSVGRRRAAEPSAAAGPYHIGFANGGGVGNGWRESSICSVKAQAVSSGAVDKVTVINHDTDAAGQLTDIRDLIAADVDAIIINPNDPDALNPAIDEAIAAGIPVIAVDAFVTAEGAYNLSNDQVEYAYLGAKSLFEQMGKTGAVVYMRGIAGHPADTDRDTGFKKALAEYPDITVAKEVVTKWDPATAVSQINDIMSSGVAVRRRLDLRRGLVDRRGHEDRRSRARAARRRGQRRLRHPAPRGAELRRAPP